MNQACFHGYLVEKSADGAVRGDWRELAAGDLPPGDVVIKTVFSSLNYKDALAAQGHPGVVRKLPHVPGIDVAGTVFASTDPRFQVGQEVVVTGYELGSGQWGGWAELVRVPADWIVPRPKGLSLFEMMILGTAGFTAAQCVQAIQRCEIGPDAGEILVTGATGGVGSLAVKLLAKLGYRVVASTGKESQYAALMEWGAARIISREEAASDSPKPMLGAKWAAAVDTVGGNTLATVIRETAPYGCVAACGLVAGAELPLTVHPFLLRGVTLAGIASALLPYSRRLEVWRLLAGEWRIDDLERLSAIIRPQELGGAVARISRGEMVGRTVLRI